MNKPFDKLSEETIHENPWWKYKHDTYLKPDGGTGDYYYGQTPGNAMVVPVREDGNIVLIRQYRYLMQKWSIEFPCGGLAGDQRSTETAKMELLEETGYRGDEFAHIGKFQALNGMIVDECHVFIARVSERQLQKLDGTEQIEVLERRIDEFESMVEAGDVWDGQTLAAWALARRHVTG